MYLPNEIPDIIEVEKVAIKIEALTGNPVTPEQKAAVAGMTRQQISEYIKELIR